MKDDSNVNDARGSLVLVRAHALAQTPEKLLPNGVIQNTFTPTEVERGSVNSRLQNSRSECRTTNQEKKRKMLNTAAKRHNREKSLQLVS